MTGLFVLAVPGWLWFWLVMGVYCLCAVGLVGEVLVSVRGKGS